MSRHSDWSVSVQAVIVVAALLAGSSFGVSQESEIEGPVYPPSPAQPVLEWAAFYQKDFEDPELAKKRQKRKKWKKLLVGDERVADTRLRLKAPIEVAIGPEGVLFVADNELGGLMVIDPSKRTFTRWLGKEVGGFSEVVGIDVGDDGSVFVADAGKALVAVFDSKLNLVRVISSEDFVRPVDVAVTKGGDELVIVDSRASKVHVVNPLTGEFLYVLGTGKTGYEEGDFHFPTAVAADDDGFVYVVDMLNHRIQVFDEAGDFQYSFGEAGGGPGTFSRPRSITVDSEAGVIYVSDSAVNRIQMFNLDGETLMWVGGPGRGRGAFELLSGISFRDGQLAAADPLCGCVQTFRFLGVPDSE